MRTNQHLGTVSRLSLENYQGSIALNLGQIPNLVGPRPWMTHRADRFSVHKGAVPPINHPLAANSINSVATSLCLTCMK